MKKILNIIVLVIVLLLLLQSIFIVTDIRDKLIHWLVALLLLFLQHFSFGMVKEGSYKSEIKSYRQQYPDLKQKPFEKDRAEEQTITQLQQDRISLQNQIFRLQQESFEKNKEYQQRIAQLENDRISLQNQISRLKQEFSEKDRADEQKIIQLEQDKLSLQEKISNLEQKITQLEQEKVPSQKQMPEAPSQEAPLSKYDFNNKSGIAIEKESGKPCCPNCLKGNLRRVALRVEETGWRCPFCEKFYPNPDYRP